MDQSICIHSYISGHVQGVWFRAATVEKAKQLGITGFAKNLADGRVEVMACGEADKLEQLQQWLHIGSPKAKVENVESKIVATQHYVGFEQR